MSKRPLNLTSHTELSTLAACEMKWHLRYREGIKGEPSDALILGRLIDVAAAHFWRNDGVSWKFTLAAEVVEQGLTEEIPDLDFIDDAEDLEIAARAYWLMKRYERHYADDLADVRVVGQQLDLRARIPGTKQSHQAIIDEIWEVDNELWMVERKTYSRNDSPEFADVSPQLTNNLWVARANGFDCKGIVYDGIYTYRWKPEKPTQKQLVEERSVAEPPQSSWHKLPAGEKREWARQTVEHHPGIDRPDEESFTRLWLPRTDKHIAAAQEDIRAGLSRRAALRRGAKPMRNLGPLCKRNCEQKAECFERLAFPQEFEIDLTA